MTKSFPITRGTHRLIVTTLILVSILVAQNSSSQQSDNQDDLAKAEKTLEQLSTTEKLQAYAYYLAMKGFFKKKKDKKEEWKSRRGHLDHSDDAPPSSSFEPDPTPGPDEEAQFNDRLAGYAQEDAQRANETNRSDDEISNLEMEISSARKLRDVLKGKKVDLDSVRLTVDAVAPDIGPSALLAHYMDQKEAGTISSDYVNNIASILKSKQFPEGILMSEAQAQQYASISNLVALLEAQGQIGKLKAEDKESLEKLKNFQHAFVFDLANRTNATKNDQALKEIFQFERMKTEVAKMLPSLNQDNASAYPILLREQALLLQTTLNATRTATTIEENSRPERYSSQLEFHDTQTPTAPFQANTRSFTN